MTFEELENVNKNLEKTDIKGKDYVQVNQRILGFRKLFPNGAITTEIVSNENGTVTIKATVVNEEEKILSTGYAQEKEGNSFINKVSYIENCETSAVGRALGILGIGTDTSVRSFDEMENKEFQVETEKNINKSKVEALKLSISNNKISEEKTKEILSKFNYKNIEEIKLKDYADIITEFQKVIGQK